MVLDAPTGDFYAFDFKTDCWVARGNVGLKKTGAGMGGIAAAILADASGATEGQHYMSKVGCQKLVLRSTNFAELELCILGGCLPFG